MVGPPSTGFRSFAEGLDLARAVTAASGLSLAGVAAFEGLITQDAGPEGIARRRLPARCRRVVDALKTADLLAPGGLVSAGGSAFFERVVAILGPAATRAGAMTEPFSPAQARPRIRHGVADDPADAGA